METWESWKKKTSEKCRSLYFLPSENWTYVLPYKMPCQFMICTAQETNASVLKVLPIIVTSLYVNHMKYAALL